MRTVTALSTATVALLAVACSAKPPTYCGDAIAQQSVFVGEQVTIEPCFEDPGGGTLKLAAASSDESVARAFLLRDNVGVGGVSPGEAQVTITATNEDDQSVETSFSVLVPNRAPDFVSDLREAEVPVNESIEWNLAEFFEEPDREEMTFEATSSNSAVGVTVDGSVAEVFGLTAGASELTLTATDPHGSKGTGTIEVTVKTPVVLVEDDFDTDASLDDWDIDPDDDYTSAEVENGYLVVTGDTSFFAVVSQDFGGEATDWTVDVVLHNPDEDTQSGFFVFTGNASYPYYLFLIGEVEIGGDIGSPNWLFAWRDVPNDTHYVSDWSYGVSNSIDDFRDHAISVSLVGDSIHGTLDGSQLFQHGGEDYLLNTALAFGLASWPETVDGGEGSINSARLRAVDFTESRPQASLRSDVAKALKDLMLKLRRR
jgi:hypothetical protein